MFLLGSSYITCGAFLIIVLVLLARHVVKKRHEACFSRLRGPGAVHWALGCLPAMIGVNVGSAALEWFDKYGQTFRAPGPLALEFVLRNTSIFPKQKPLRRQLARYLDNGVVVAEGEEHRRQRKMLQSSFAPTMIKGYHSIFAETSERLKEKLLGQVAETEDGSLVVDMLKHVMAWSLDIIGLAGFDHPMGGISGEANELARAFEASVLNFGRISPVWVLQSMIPFFDHIPNPVTYRMKANRRETRRISKEIFEEKRRGVLDEQSAFEGKKDMLSNLLRANMSEKLEARDRLPDSEVVAQIGTLLLAGKANTAFGVTWLLWELARHPEVQRRLREELDSAGDHPGPDALAALPYLNAVIRESLRLHPSVPQTMRVATEDVVIPLQTPIINKDGSVMETVFVPKGTTVAIPIVYANRSAELWGPTALEFRPERFFSPLEEGQGSAGMWGSILTFIDGPRGCIGYRFALAEIRTILHTLLRSFAFELDADIQSWFAIKNQPISGDRAFLDAWRVESGSIQVFSYLCSLDPLDNPASVPASP